jgi:hypothetical protein
VSGRPWTREEEDILRAKYPRCRHARELRRHLPGRTAVAIQEHGRRVLGLRTRRRWTNPERAALRKLWHDVGQRALRERLGGRPWTEIRREAKRLGLPMGIPQGYEFLTAAAERTGFSRSTLERMLAWAGVQVHRHYGWTGPVKFRQRYVEPEAVDEAVAKWLKTETPTALARRLGACGPQFAVVLRRAGLLPPLVRGGPAPKHQRVDSEAAERAWREREDLRKFNGPKPKAVREALAAARRKAA